MAKTVHLDKVLAVVQNQAIHFPPKNRTAPPLLTNITMSSHDVQEKGMFLAVQGTAQNGEQYIPVAIKNGATCIVCRQEAYEEFAPHFDETVRFFVTPNVRALIAPLAVLFYPNRPTYLLGVTGTNGKSSVVGFVQQLLGLMDINAASIGTLGVCSNDVNLPGSVTTPDPIMLYKILDTLADKGVDCVAIEASSHGLDQNRLAAILFDAVGFTNLTRDHLDYHPSFHAYFEAKQRLFKEHLKPTGVAVLNADILEYQALDKVCQPYTCYAYGKGAKELHVNYIQLTDEGQNVSLTLFGQKYHVTIPLLGRFQVSNILCAMGLIAGVYGQDIMPRLVSAAPQVKGVPGRLEYVGKTVKGARIFIDYAHTPDALATALQALRHHTSHQLHVVFGCGGNRDKGKRPLMGQVAAQYADHVIITDDNPRFEDPGQIRQEIMAACPDARNIADRYEAIREAMRTLEAGDMLLIAGKGHEEGQKVGNEILPFQDGQAVQKILGELTL